MRFLILFFLVLTFLFEISFSQSLDSLVIGKKYEITLFDEKELTGTLVSPSESQNSIKNKCVNATLYKKDILSESKDIPPSKYKFLATLNSGIVSNSYYIGYNSSFIINGRFSYFYSDKKNLGADISYTSFNYDNNYDHHFGKNYNGGKQSYFDLILNAQVGTFDKVNVVDLYANIGAGVHVSHRTSSTIIYYSISGSNSFTNRNPSTTRFYPVVQIGGGILIKPVYNFGINLEIDMVAYFRGFYILQSGAFFPVKAGISYYFMK